ncbi:putative Glycosyltransferase, group 2 family protein [Candidatus Desulfarcum epimagneticum]|uniref:Putative Glycosyltransferase, group 2 family protein n=1 Tax=uncultured Desulfobacteraceae bacterium TaxID=218296 RepID=A0A484HI98_9BACT|nr:putative Glycosyltransferase, group 2 family protein [uncultured Desulfobacteraceae bacterium]
MALIIPTMNRPSKLQELLFSITRQTVSCGRIIVIDGAESAKPVIDNFHKKLPVEYFKSLMPGQIRQRNIGIDKLKAENRLVGFLDDDLVLEENAIEEMIFLWNSLDIQIAGIGFNIVNAPVHRHSKLKSFFCMDHIDMGRVLSSGMNTSINNISTDMKTQWLGGGYTVWRHEVLKEFPQKALNTKWAVGEDIRFSYPIGKKYPLYVSGKAKVRHHHVYDQATPAKLYRYRGRKVAMAFVYFVLSHKELSVFACYWMLFFLAMGKCVKACITGQKNGIDESVGLFYGFFESLFYVFGAIDIKNMLEDHS